MAKYTVDSLIETLSKFPRDLPIETELSLMWNYPEHLKKHVHDIDTKLFAEYTMENAIELYIFEGSWDKGNISDVDGKLKKVQKK